MKTLLAATALALSITAANAADAPKGSTVLAGGPIFANAEVNLFCEYINFGATNITPTSQQIFASNSTTAIASTSDCPNGTAVPPNSNCAIFPKNALANFNAYSCKVTFSTAARNVRGTVELYDSSNNVVATAELR